MMNTLPFLPPRLQKRTAAQPILLVRNEELLAGDHDPFTFGLRKHLSRCPEWITSCLPCLGSIGPLPPQPKTIVTGVCLGATSAEKQLWKDLGPSVGSVCEVDAVLEIGDHVGAEVNVWITDNEYAVAAVEQGGTSRDAAELILDVGQRVNTFFSERHPSTNFLRTSLPEVRKSLYSTLITPELARVLPARVHAPWGKADPSLWKQIEFLGCVATILEPVLRGSGPVWAILDHDQVRVSAAALCAAERLGFLTQVGCILYWPAPSLTWDRTQLAVTNTREGWRLLRDRGNPRRMHSTANLAGKLFIQDDESSIRARANGSSYSSWKELLAYLDTGADSGPGEDIIATMAETLKALRTKVTARS